MWELAKIALRNRNVTNPYSNFSQLRSLHQVGLPDVLVVSSQARQEFLHEQGISAYHVPLGWSHYAHDQYEGRQKDIDVLFLGIADLLRTPRRRQCLRRLRKESISPLVKGSWSDPECWGEKRKELLNRAKIFINIHRYPSEFEGARLLRGMANKALVISEPIYRPAPYEPGIHYVSVPMEKMASAIRYYLEHAEQREKIADAGYEFVTKKLSIENSINKVIKLIQERMHAKS